MSSRILSRPVLWAAFFALTSALCLAVWTFGYSAALEQLERRARADLALAASRLTGELQRYRSLAVLTADRPDVAAVLDDQTADPDFAEVLREMADKTGTLDVLIVAEDGSEILNTTGTLGRAHGGSPYFNRAMDGALGVYHLVDPRYKRRVFYYAAPVFAPDGPVRGAVIVVVDVNAVESAWRGDELAVFFTDELEVVFVSNRSELVFRTKGSDTRMVGQSVEYPAGLVGPFVRHDVRSWRNFTLWQIDGGPYLPDRALHLTLPMPVIDMVGEALPDVAPARQLAFLQTVATAAAMLAFGAVLFWVAERRRVLARLNVELERRVQARTTELQAVNVDLKRTQADLVQAEKLSALGHMSAGISHELNQPLMAIRSFAENGKAFLTQGKAEIADQNLGRIAQLAERMDRIIRNLRAFARNESEPLGKVDLIAVVSDAIDLLQPRLSADEVQLVWDAPKAPILVQAGEVRLSQVIVNLMTNALDAMEGSSDRRLIISVTHGPEPQLSIRDLGPGIAEPDQIFDPFYSTKSVGSAEGLGLGLSISYGLVQSFGGAIQGRNHPQGGAVFTVTLNPAADA
ncbi:MAG: ATP-binding protein [Pseudomonadota bacterium]